MTMYIASVPCCWGEDDINNPLLPPWESCSPSVGCVLDYQGYITVAQERDPPRPPAAAPRPRSPATFETSIPVIHSLSAYLGLLLCFQVNELRY